MFGKEIQISKTIMNRLLVTGYCLSATALFLSPLSAEEGEEKGVGGGWFDVGGAKKQGLRPHMEVFVFVCFCCFLLVC